MNKYFGKILTAALMGGSIAMTASAVPAKPGLLTVKQADGSALNVRLVGDERSHFYLSEDGYLLANDNDTYYYANVNASGTIIRSDIRATAASLRDRTAHDYLRQVDMERVYKAMSSRASQRRMKSPMRGPGLFPGNHFPSKGEQKAIVVLVQYTDVKMSLDNAHDYFHRMLNEPGFSDYGGTGSAVDFFTENSSGQFIPQFDVYGPLTLAHDMAYYGGNDWYGNDQRPEQMVIEACQQLDATVDFSEYDRDGDGFIDNVFVFYAGRGEADGGSANTVWPHSWDITSATDEPYIFDGVQLDRYGCSNEWAGSRPDGVGTFVHEFSHVMGLPDLYATSYTGAFTPGSWSALDHGPYNNDGRTPPLYSAFERYALGWLDPLPVDGPLNATLHPIDSNRAGIIKTAGDNEFFLLENRQQTGWDAYIPGHGMLIWHVDYNSDVWNANTVNNSSGHQYVDIEEADGTRNEYSRDGDSFPGTAGKTSFTDNTTPSMLTWSRQRLNLPITDIAESTDGVITFKVCGGREPLSPTDALEAIDITAESFTAVWAGHNNGDKYVLDVYTRDANGNKTYVTGYQSLNVGPVTEYDVTGLEPETDYFYTVSVGDGWEESAPSNEIAVFTGRLPLNRRAVTATEADKVTQSGFTANWLALDDAESYMLDVYTKEWGMPLTDGCDFTDGVTALPEGWSSTSEASYANSAYSGTAVPSLRLGVTGDYLLTPVYGDEIKFLRFWHRGSNAASSDRIDIHALTDGEWAIVAQLPVVNDKGGVTSGLEAEIPGGTVQLRIEYVRTGAKGAIALDDVVVGHGITFSAVAVDGLTGYPAGNGTSCAIDGLDASTEYFYTVRATGADGLVSLPSQEIAVTTADDGGGSGGITDGATITSRLTVDGRSAVLSGAPAGTDMTVTDIAGRTVALSTAGADGLATAQLPDSGVYIVSAPAAGIRVKILVK